MRARLAASLVVDNVKRDALALPEHVRVRDVAPVDKNICAAIIRSDETEAAIFLPTSTHARGHFVVLFFRLPCAAGCHQKHPAELCPAKAVPERMAGIRREMEKPAANW
jgi:hypothetical protein